MSKLNEMRMYAWNHTGLNWVDGENSIKEKKEYFKKSDENSIEELENAFKDLEYGIGSEINKENRDFRNYSLYRNLSGINKTETIDLKMDQANNTLLSGVDINLKENSSASFLINAFGSGENLYINSQIRVNLNKASKAKIVIVTNLPEKSKNLLSFTSIIGEDAFLDISYIELGNDYSLVNIKNILKGDRAKLVEEGIYFKEKDQFLDILAENDHYGNKTDSATLFNGALKDRASKNWKGVVDLKNGCHKADGKIADYSMMFSDQVKNKTAPILLCREKEVAGNHAASVGRLNKDMLFYIMSRGFDKKKAESMMLEATFAKTLDKIEDQKLKDELRKKVHQMNTRD